ncbi:MAG: aminotransferase class V-fold PLP-dependent enzyme [Gammaproteobacteria bacterium]|nr:aminotransferase class V-fold PLP-dependent enzyme [Gammaproteobacteria bacterium]
MSLPDNPLPLDLEFVRNAFAGLEPHAGDHGPQGEQPWLFFDNAGGAFVLEEVIERTAEYLRSTPVQIGASYPRSKLAADRQSEAIAKLAKWINAGHEQEVIVGPSASALTLRLAISFGDTLVEGDEIIVTSMDHEANRTPWLRLAKQGAVIRTWMAGPDGTMNLDDLDALLNDRTRLVCLGHCSNIVGNIEPVREVADKVHAAGAKLFVDGVAYAPHRPVDVRELDADFYVFSLYKTFGPHAGLLWGKRQLLLDLPGINHEFVANDYLPYKFQPGGANYELTWGSAAIPDYLSALDEHQGGTGDRTIAWAAIADHESQLARRLLDYLDAREDITILGSSSADPAQRLPIISFTIAGRKSQDVVQQLEQQHIAARFGNFHAKRLIEQFGLEPADGVVRVSFAHYNALEDVDRLVDALEGIKG